MNVENLRERILNMQAERQRQEVLDILDGYRFGVYLDGRFGDPMSHAGAMFDDDAELRERWCRMLKDTFADHHDLVRVCVFTQGWAALDKNSRIQLVEENSNLFHPARASWLKGLSDSECDVLQASEPWAVYYHLTSEDPIHGVRHLSEMGEYHSDLALPSPYAMAA